MWISVKSLQSANESSSNIIFLFHISRVRIKQLRSWFESWGKIQTDCLTLTWSFLIDRISDSKTYSNWFRKDRFHWDGPLFDWIELGKSKNKRSARTRHGCMKACISFHIYLNVELRRKIARAWKMWFLRSMCTSVLPAWLAQRF